MGLSELFGFNLSDNSSSNLVLDEIFPMQYRQGDFVRTDVQNIYSKILTDVFERTQGLSEEQNAMLFDNCLASESEAGLITMISKAMAEKGELFLKYDKALDLIRKATSAEQAEIKQAHKDGSEVKEMAYVSFKNYDRSDMIKLYSSMEYSVISGLSKSAALSKAIQVKLSNLRSSTGLTDKAEIEAQAKAIAEGLGKGKDVALDAKDSIDSTDLSIDPIRESINFLNQKRAFYLGLPSSYITGVLNKGGLSDTGEADQKAVERGLRNYYFSIVRPIMSSLFGIKTKYKSQDFRQITQALEALKTFDLVSETYISDDNKKLVIESLLDIEAGENKTANNKE